VQDVIQDIKISDAKDRKYMWTDDDINLNWLCNLNNACKNLPVSLHWFWALEDDSQQDITVKAGTLGSQQTHNIAPIFSDSCQILG